MNNDGTRNSKVTFDLPQNSAKKKSVSERKNSRGPSDFKKLARLRLHKNPEDAVISAVQPSTQPEEHEKPKPVEEESRISRWTESFKQYCDKSDVYASTHATPFHRLCISIAVGLIPFLLIIIIWDLVAALIFEIPDLSFINAPLFILIISFVAIPLSLYGYMTEYLLHEYSRLSIVALICIFVHPILFLVRAYMEYLFDGFRNEQAHYIEILGSGERYDYPVGTFSKQSEDKDN